jgi:hypothetical protein
VLALVPSSLAQQPQSGSAKRQSDQVNPCDAKGKIVSDVGYCDRYWECVNGQPELYDCPNGLAFAGRNRGVADGCDYPWRGNYCEGKQLASKKEMMSWVQNGGGGQSYLMLLAYSFVFVFV